MVHELLTALGVVFLTINVLYSILLFIYTRDLSRNYSNAIRVLRNVYYKLFSKQNSLEEIRMLITEALIESGEGF